MAQDRRGKARWIITAIVLGHLLATLIATGCLYWWGDPEHWGVTLTLRILWGVWAVHALAQALTRVTIFGWSFRRYFRPSEEEKPPPPPLRPAKAPWYKSGKVSFAITVILVSLTGACAITTAVMYILEDVTGHWVYWLVCMIVWSSWWVLAIALVLTRLAIFGSEKQKAKQIPSAGQGNGQQPQTHQEPSLVGRESPEGSS
jgi:hypothetical protein